VELDDSRGGLIRVRPTSSDPIFDLKPYEELGCNGLPALSDLIRRELARIAEGDGLSPFDRESFEPILSSAASRLDPGGCYAPDAASPGATNDPSRLTVTDQWALFARPRSQHVVLQDIERLRRAAQDEKYPLSAVAERIVTEPSRTAPRSRWGPLNTRIGGSQGEAAASEPNDSSFDVFFPLPFNDDQIEIIRRLKQADGLVVQGPPGTGKTHTIANLICHAMATGERVLVVSRGESALAVLKAQLPEEVQPLAIAILSSERQGLRQIESAIREIQSVVEGTRPESRYNAIRRMEAEIAGLQKRLAEIDRDLDRIAAAHLSKIGPRGESPAALAQRIVREREGFAWFSDRPVKFVSDTGLSELEVAALEEARQRVGEWLDHIDAKLPSPADLPSPETVRGWHEDLIRAEQLQQAVGSGPVRTLRIAPDNAGKAQQLAEALRALVATHHTRIGMRWIEPLRRAALRGDNDGWCGLLRERLDELEAIDEERFALARRSVELPPGLFEDDAACEAIGRAADGEHLWPVISVGKSASKALVGDITLDGAALRYDDIEGWRHVRATLSHMRRREEAKARWRSFAAEVGAPGDLDARTSVEVARTALRAADEARLQSEFLVVAVSGFVSMEALGDDPELCRELADQISAGVGALRLASVHEHIRRNVGLLGPGSDRTSTTLRQFLEQVVGRSDVAAERVEALWRSAIQRVAAVKARANDFATIGVATSKIAKAGAPTWAKRLHSEPAAAADSLVPTNWRDAWDHAAADAALVAIDARERLTALAQERAQADQRRQRLFAQLVRERTFFELDRRLSPAIKSALVVFVRALARIGRGTGKTAPLHRRTAREAMARCYDALPCWIMPTWRVAEQLPPELGAVDLVIIDEASQSDVTELPALLRGKKILVVGDDRQVSPTAPFVTQAKIVQLRHQYLGELPFNNLLEPGESVYDLMRAVFPNDRLMLKEHFRCVEPIIRFSMQFYPEKMLPLRIPKTSERLDPPLVDFYLPHGRRESHRKINAAEAELIVSEILALTTRPSTRPRSIGVISLIGAQQAEYIRAKLSEMIGEELMQRHAILCGDSATFQGTERDIVFLSMVADPVHRTALTMPRYEQRFNVAVSRARDRVVLVRSVRREDLNPEDLKARLIAHFENPMPLNGGASDEGLAACESGFERDLMQRLLDRGFRVRAQVGAPGFRIDLVVEGKDGRRLAVECDGDRFHGPEQWREDMRRQRVLERVGWQFWRCFASSFYRNPEAVTDDLFGALARMGIEPAGKVEHAVARARLTEHVVVHPETAGRAFEPAQDVDGEDRSSGGKDIEDGQDGIAIGDRTVLLFEDDKKRLALRVTAASQDLEKGLLASTSSLGRAVIGSDEGDEVEFVQEDGRLRKVLIESVDKARHTNGATAARFLRVGAGSFPLNA
jgi:very-short-patch-repair endonuclease